MEEFEKRLEKASPENIRERIRYLKDIMSRKIPLEKGQMEWLNKPETINKNVTETGGVFSKIGEGVYGKVFKVCVDKLCKYEFILKETLFKNTDYYPDTDYPYRPENIEPRILKILNEFIYTGVTPHILLYLGDFTASIKSDKYRYLLMEKADTDFQKICKNANGEEKDAIMKNIIFQILYTLKVIQKKYPDFIHNDLKPDNILCFIPNKNLDGKFYKYTLNGKDYYLPHNYRMVLSDFGISSINSKDCNNAHVEILGLELDLGIQTEKNHYKDVYKIFAMLRDFYVVKESETDIFLRKYLYGKKDNYYNLLPNIERFSIEQILKDPYFDIYRIPIEEDKIIESFSDEYIDPSLTNLNAMPEISKELTFNCYDYKSQDLWYADYKISESLNDSYRKNCLPGSKDPIENLNYDIPKDVSNLDIYISERMGKREDVLKKIENVYKYLLEKYANEVNIPRPSLDYFKTAIYRKACIYVTYYHPQNSLHSINLIDAIIQYNKFLSSFPNK